MMDYTQKEILKARAKSLAWRVGAMVAIAAVDYLSTNIGAFNMSPQMVVFSGLILGEITKFLNSNLREFVR